MTKKIIIGIFAVIGFLYVLMTIYVTTFVDCRHPVTGETISPNSEYKANYYIEVCDETPPRIQVLIGKINENLQMVVFSSLATTTDKVSLTWRSDTNLLIKYPEALNPDTIHQSMNNVYISYEKY